VKGRAVVQKQDMGAHVPQRPNIKEEEKADHFHRVGLQKIASAKNLLGSTGEGISDPHPKKSC